MNPAPAAGRGPRMMALGLAGVMVALAGAVSLAVAGEREAVFRMKAPPAAAPAAVDAEPRVVDPGAGPTAPDQKAAIDTARSTLTPEQQARYRRPTGRQYQTLCASQDPGDDGFCAGVMFSVLQNADRFGVCPPAALEQGDESARDAALGDLVDRGKAEIARGTVRAEDAAFDVARAALARAYPCAVARGATEVVAQIPVALDYGREAPTMRPGEMLTLELSGQAGDARLAKRMSFSADAGGRAPDVVSLPLTRDYFPTSGQAHAFELSAAIGVGETARLTAQPTTLRLAPGSEASAGRLAPTLFFE